MDYPVKIGRITPALEYFNEVVECVESAKEYLSGHVWCKEIREGWLFTNLGRPLCICAFEIENLQSPEDNLLWVMTGDFPSIYLDTYSVKTTKEVVENYISLGKEWIEAVQLNRSLEHCYPFEIPHNDLVKLFKNRIAALEERIVDHIDNLSVSAIHSS